MQHRFSGDSQIGLQHYSDGRNAVQTGYGLQSSSRAQQQFPPSLQPRSKRGLWFGLTFISLLIIVGAVVGGVIGTRDSHSTDHVAAAAAASQSASSVASVEGTTRVGAQAGNARGVIWPTGTDAWGEPLYPTTTGEARIAAPTTVANASLSCGMDPYGFSDPASLAVRKEHPLLWAPPYKWECLQRVIPQDEYMSFWNDTIFLNATKFYGMTPTNYSIDGGLGGSGVLDVAREVQLRIKHWGYAYQMTNDTKWVDRCWLEVQTAAGNSTTGQYFGETGDNWNALHFLDLAEFTVAFAMAYDWFYDAWTAEQKNAIMWSILNLGLAYGNDAYNDPTGSGADFTWWTKVTGNWNCVCSGGMIIGALAIMNEDPTGLAEKLLPTALANINGNCAFAVSDDGTWSETVNYWYFGTTQHTAAASALLSATGSTQDMLTVNPAMKLSSLFHMYATGSQGLFNYGDTGPNKYTATANGLMFYGQQYDIPMYTLFQRDRADAPEPMSLMYYDAQVSGNYWDGLALDHYFENTTDAWVSMRSSWTDTDGTYVAMKAGALEGHQTHGNVDTGDFVLDAIGQRWAGEFGDGNYLATGYFSSESQDSVRWEYYRDGTIGQNTLLMGGQNQNVSAVPTTTFGTSGDNQTALVYNVANSSTAFFTADLTTTYNGSATTRAIRMLNGRKQILLQDDMDVPSQGVQWRIQTNATITMSNGKKTATWELGGQTLIAMILSPSAAVFSTALPVPLASSPAVPPGAESANQPNPGVTVLTIDLPVGQTSLQVLFNPQWPNFTSESFTTPPSVAITDWTLTSHDV